MVVGGRQRSEGRVKDRCGGIIVLFVLKFSEFIEWMTQAKLLERREALNLFGYRLVMCYTF